MSSTFFLWAKWEKFFCLFYILIRICFKENDGEVHGRSSSVSFWQSKANGSVNFFFNRYLFISAASFFMKSSCFFGLNTSFSLALTLLLLHL